VTIGTADAVNLSGAFVVASLEILKRHSNTNSYFGRNDLASLLRYLSREAEDDSAGGMPMSDGSAQALADLGS
jgi:predicted house-cleaning NTP pyrophosphatase (Maf/HAM1 superfamily)